MKKTIALLLAVVMLFALLAGCGAKETTDTKKEDPKTETTDTKKEEATETKQPENAVVVAEGVELTPSGAAYADLEAAIALGETDEELVVGLNADWKDLSPYGTDGGGKWWTTPHINGYLASSDVFGAQFEDFRPGVAKRMEKIDGTTYEFEIWDCVEDTLGNPIKASDVKFSLETIGAAPDFQSIGNSIKEVEIVDDYTVRIHLATEEIGAIELIMLKTAIVSQAWYESVDSTERSTNPIGCGRYEITGYAAGDFIEMTRKEDYWQKDTSALSHVMFAPFKKITFKLIKDNSVRTVALENGEVDIVKNLNVNDIGRFLNADGTAIDGFTVAQCYDGRVNVLGFNCWETSIFADENLRKAVLYGIDAEELMLAYGLDESTGRVTHDVTTQCCSDYNPEWDSADYDYYKRDVEKAKEYLKAAGYEPGELTVNLLVKNSQPGYEPTAVYMQAQLAEVGINVEISCLEQAITDEMVNSTEGWEMVIEGVNSCSTVAEGYSYLFNQNNWANGGRFNINDDKLQEMVENVVQVDKYSAEAVEELHNYVMEKGYVYGLFAAAAFHVAQDGIQGICTISDGNPTMSASIVSPDYQSASK